MADDPGVREGESSSAHDPAGQPSQIPSDQIPSDPQPVLTALQQDAAGATVPDTPDLRSETRSNLFPVVGIGASAGGLAAFETFFANTPTDPQLGMAFVLVQHLDPDHRSILVDLVRRYTRMEVFEAQDGMPVAPGCTYIIPPRKDLALLNGRLHLMDPTLPRGLRLPIDFFFRSIAQDLGEHAICVILSGTGTDGTLGLRAIKEAGGMAMVQAPESAGHDGMPRSAISTGLADFVLSPKDMPDQLIAYTQRIMSRGQVAPPASVDLSGCLQKIFILLRAQTGHDFSYYKQSTIGRRIERRMAVNQIDRADLYVRYMRENPTEVDTLFRELLIGVTSFFRDPQAFEAITENVLPHLFSERPDDGLLRIWVPGCSTGEEAYSIAILFQEYVDRVAGELEVQVFGTDIDGRAIEKARTGLYPASIVADVSPERLSRFFVAEQDDAFRIRKSTRDALVFAEQDLVKDPPFSRIDMICCRNLLIYMGAELQRKVVPLFHYALKPGGVLFLGSSETIGDFTDLFTTLDRKWKLYQRRETTVHRVPVADMPVPTARLEPASPEQASEPSKGRKISLRDLTEKALLGTYAPASVVVNDQGDILYVHGRTGNYLELSSGEVSVNIVRIAREGLRAGLNTALRQVANTREEARYDGLRIDTNLGCEVVNLVVRPLKIATSGQSLSLVAFEPAVVTPVEEPEPEVRPLTEQTGDQRVIALERELKAKEEFLQTTIEELEASNEELKSTNEELQSTNEELQSTNEELETSKEELQSVNEELVTVNVELQKKVEELSRANNDMNNLLAGTGIGTIFVDHELRIQRFTPAATELINLIQTDIGRPVGHIVSNLVGYDSLVADLRAVLSDLIPRESEVRTAKGQWFLMRIRPYRTLSNVIEGGVITFVDISEQKRLGETLGQSEQSYRQFSEAIHDSVIVYGQSGDFLDCNRATLERYGYSRDEFLRLRLSDLVPSEHYPAVNQAQGAILAGLPTIVESAYRCRDGRIIPVEISASRIDRQGVPAILAVARDLNRRKHGEQDTNAERLKARPRERAEEGGRDGQSRVNGKP